MLTDLDHSHTHKPSTWAPTRARFCNNFLRRLGPRKAGFWQRGVSPTIFLTTSNWSICDALRRRNLGNTYYVDLCCMPSPTTATSLLRRDMLWFMLPKTSFGVSRTSDLDEWFLSTDATLLPSVSSITHGRRVTSTPSISRKIRRIAGTWHGTARMQWVLIGPQLFGHFQSWITTWHRARCQMN